jgi:hypothetical protein
MNSPAPSEPALARCAKGALAGGLSSGLLAGVLFPVLWLVGALASAEVRSVDHIALEAIKALGIAPLAIFFGGIVGLAVCGTYGLLVLYLFDKRGLNRPRMMAAVGAASTAVPVVWTYLLNTKPPGLWLATTAYLALIGAATAWVASCVSQPTAARRAEENEALNRLLSA